MGSWLGNFQRNHRVWTVLIVVVLLVVVFLALLMGLNRLFPGSVVQGLVTVGAVIAALLALSGVLVAQAVSAYTVWSEKRRQEKERKSEAYQTYVAAYDATQQWSRGEGKSEESEEYKKHSLEYSRAYAALFQVASDTVLRAIMAFHAGASLDREERVRLYWRMVIEMRKDIIATNQISEAEIVDKLPRYVNQEGEEKAQDPQAQDPQSHLRF